ncbi:MAG: hypothetical protein ACK5LX_09425 [Oscillospiraceae bacterium]
MSLSENDSMVLRQLAQQYMEIALDPRQEEKKQLWLSLNRFQMQKPMLMIDQIPWHEMDVDGLLKNQVEEPYWRGVETELRRTIYKWRHMPVDLVVNPYITLPRPINYTGYGLAVEMETLESDRSNDVISQHYENQFQEMEDVEKISTPQAILDKEAETVIRQQAEQLFQGIAPFVMTGLTLHLGVWDAISQWMGVENVYIELIDRPELLHAIMERLTVANIALIEQMNRDGLFDVYTNLCHCSHTFTDDLPGPDCDLDNPTSKDAWAFGLAQLFTSVSPQVTAEFEVPYMQRLFPYFGAIYYGCCDRLDDRLDVITKMPKIRKISCSPWSEREVFAEKLPRGYVMSNKPNPAFLAGETVDWDYVRADIRRTVDVAKAYDVPLELILKDLSTVRYQPQRLWEWSRLALEEVAK